MTSKKIIFFILVFFISLSITFVALPRGDNYSNSYDSWQHYYKTEKIAAGEEKFSLSILPYPLYLHTDFALIFSIVGFSLNNMHATYLFFVIILNILNFLVFFYIGKEIKGFSFGLLCAFISSIIVSSESWLGLIWPLPSTAAYILIPLSIFYFLKKEYFKFGILILFELVVHPWSLFTIFIGIVGAYFILSKPSFNRIKKKHLVLALIFLFITVALIFINWGYTHKLIGEFFRSSDLLKKNPFEYLIYFPLFLLSILGIFYAFNRTESPFIKTSALSLITLIIVILLFPEVSKRLLLHVQIFMVFSIALLIFSLKNRPRGILIIFFVVILSFNYLVPIYESYSKIYRVADYELESFYFLKNTSSNNDFILSDGTTLVLARSVIPRFGFETNINDVAKDTEIIHEIFFDESFTPSQKVFICSKKIKYIIISPRTRFWTVYGKTTSVPVWWDEKMKTENKFLDNFERVYNQERISIFKVGENFCL